MIAEKFPDIQQLSPSDKIALVSELWEELEAIGNGLPVTEEQKQILDGRFAIHGDNPKPGSSWPEVKQRLLRDIG